MFSGRRWIDGIEKMHRNKVHFVQHRAATSDNLAMGVLKSKWLMLIRVYCVKPLLIHFKAV